MEKLLRAKAIILGVGCTLQVGFKRVFINQPHLADLDPFQLTCTQHTPEILNVVSAMVFSSFYGYAINNLSWG